MSVAETAVDPMIAAFHKSRDREATGFESAWAGIEPTFQSKTSIRKWAKMAAKPGGEDAYFRDPYMQKKQRAVAKQIKKNYEAQRAAGQPCCMFAKVELDEDLDQWKVRRQNLRFFWDDPKVKPFTVRFTLDPETFEYSIKPVPLAWFYDERFVTFLETFLWQTPRQLGLSVFDHGGGQFSFSAKTFLTGSLLADDIAYKLNHPELASLIMDWPNGDDRCFRATKPRFEAFKRMLDAYWAGGFHPRANGVLTAENAYLDRGFGPAPSPPKGLMHKQRGPVGDDCEVFQCNFAFGRAVRLHAQYVHPGYWQGAHPNEAGYRPDQIMRYSEGNLNRLQIAGEWHVKSGKVLQGKRAPEFSAPLEIGMLTTEASWENRGQMSRTSARDFVEAMMLDVHHAQYLQAHPHVAVLNSLLQDQLFMDAEETMKRHGGSALLDRLHQEARKKNLKDSLGRLKSDWIEPETLFWEAWKILPAGEKANIAREAIGGFIERVEQAASMDQRPPLTGDPMEWHRHRIHPKLWKALEETPSVADDPVQRELRLWTARKKEYLARRPKEFSVAE